MFSKSQEGKNSTSDGPESSDDRSRGESDDRGEGNPKGTPGSAEAFRRQQSGDGGRKEAAFRSVIGQELTISGNVSAEGPVQLDGLIEGDVRCVAITVGQSGFIKGNVIADEVEVSGRVVGDIHGKKVQLRAEARVKGDINHTALTIEQGALFEGHSRPADMSDADMGDVRSLANGANNKDKDEDKSEEGSSKKSEQKTDSTSPETIKAVT